MTTTPTASAISADVTKKANAELAKAFRAARTKYAGGHRHRQGRAERGDRACLQRILGSYRHDGVILHVVVAHGREYFRLALYLGRDPRDPAKSFMRSEAV